MISALWNRPSGECSTSPTAPSTTSSTVACTSTAPASGTGCSCARRANADDASQRELAELMRIEPPTLVRHLDKLAEEGLVERRPDPARPARPPRRRHRRRARAARPSCTRSCTRSTTSCRGILTKRDAEVLGRALPRIHAYFDQDDQMHAPSSAPEGRASDDGVDPVRRWPVAADDVVIRTEKLTKIYPGGLMAVDELDLDGAPGRDLRSARARTARARRRPRACSRRA